ncbi:hypothetical protein [Sphingomonas psychrotolerans]|uniref:Uncharacterized protein n=1 Tax=Sphingomonas psychrotolerans TaxID=1327635 RepID=A0A2K8MAN5_9SPHN|nr:hypothetical protein [Sphingomonas psychrotolerans]ATY30907.1 hypothetical protein CVN68_02000 [Sphingomonas psychrotolerans]
MSRWQELQTRSRGDDARCGLPAGFFRLRYFHGKQMRLADYVDEQRYHAGKMRFHNERLHGAGILCGLGVSLLDPDGVALRVARGAALDDCGREIVVGHDQCVDVDAWYRAQKKLPRRDEDNPCHPDKENRVRICVVIRYAECSGAPEPAPRNPCVATSGCGCGGSCGCGGGSGPAACPDPCGVGAEFGRVTEEFELRLMFHPEARRLTEHRLFPNADAIDQAVLDASGGIGLLTALAAPIRTGCPGSDEGWLLLACFSAVVEGEDDEAKIVRVDDIDLECASQVLLSTEVIQYLLASLYAEIDPSIGGPEIIQIALRRLDEARYQVMLSLSAPIDRASLDESANFDLRRLNKTGWDRPENNVVSAEYHQKMTDRYPIDGPAIYLTIDNSDGFLAADARYQLFTPRDADPVVDPQLRQLRPRDLAWRFRLCTDADSGDLVAHPIHGHAHSEGKSDA